ncbi:MAG: ATP-binding protein [Acidobacteriota bacterium]|nr:ATP-binding protein [Acidobacteriota bacterium]
MSVYTEQSRNNSWQFKGSNHISTHNHEQASKNAYSVEKDESCSAFITQNPVPIWRIELKHPVSTLLSQKEQIEQISRFGFLAECNDALARSFGSDSSIEMIRHFGDSFPVNLFTDAQMFLRDFVQAGYRLENVKSARRESAGNERHFSTDVFGVVENRRLTQIWGMQREEKQVSAESSDFYQAVIDSMLEHIAIIDQKGQIIATNDAWKRFAGNNDGKDKDKLDVGANYFAACRSDGGELAQEVDEGIRAVLNKQKDYFTVEYPCHCPTGEERWFLLHVTPLSGTSGAVVSHLNITKRKKAEQERQKALDELKTAMEENEIVNRMKDEFLSTISHELRTPLTSMLGWTKLIRSGKLDEKSIAQGLETIERNTLVQSRLIEDLLDISRIINGKIKLEAFPVKVRSLVETAVESIKPTASIKHIAIEFRSEIEDATVYADPRRIQQILWNLLSNAIKFTPRNGFVFVNLNATREAVEVSVTDNGIGISPEFLPHLFKHFRQQDASITRKHGGLGLGLSIARHLVELHGGQVKAQSAGEGKGSVFTFTLPLMNARVESLNDINNVVAPDNFDAPKKTETQQKLEGVNLLLVEDDTDSLELLAFLFESTGATVRTAKLASLAFEQFQENPPDLLISDIGMPDEDGYSLIRKIRQLSPEKGGNVPAIALTAYAKNEDRLKALSCGFQRHIKKPIEPLDLIQQVSEMLAQQKTK